MKHIARNIFAALLAAGSLWACSEDAPVPLSLIHI